METRYILAHRIKTYLNSISIETKFHYRSSKDVCTIIVYLPNNSKGWYS